MTGVGHLCERTKIYFSRKKVRLLQTTNPDIQIIQLANLHGLTKRKMFKNRRRVPIFNRRIKTFQERKATNTLAADA